MATVTAAAATTCIPRTTFVLGGAAGVSSSLVLGLPQIRAGRRRVECSLADKAKVAVTAAPAGIASMLAAVSVMTASNPALALVDERMSTEGTGLSLGLSNNILGWILLGIFGLIWSFYIVYTSTLEEDEDSGLSL